MTQFILTKSESEKFYSSEEKNIFKEQFSDIEYLKIETLPGVQFYLNSSAQSCIVGNSGIFELDVRNTSLKISLLYFSQKSIEDILTNNCGYLYINIEGTK